VTWIMNSTNKLLLHGAQQALAADRVAAREIVAILTLFAAPRRQLKRNTFGAHRHPRPLLKVRYRDHILMAHPDKMTLHAGV
jgi:hypothetical protein